MEWLLVIIVFSLLIFVHELGHFVMALRAGIKVEIFSIGMGPKIFSVTKNGIEYRISAVPIGGYVKMLGEDPSEPSTGNNQEFQSQSVWARFLVLIGGVTMNYILAYILFCGVFMAGYPNTTTVNSVVDDMPAKAAGIEAKDKIVAIDGKEVRYWMVMVSMIKKKTNGPVQVTVMRNGSLLNLSVIPNVKETKTPFGIRKTAVLGISGPGGLVMEKSSFVESLGKGFDELIQLTKLTYQMFGEIIIGRSSIREGAGPVGIIQITAIAAKAGLSHLLFVTALISMSLAIFNLLPIPVLDGGLIFFLIIEIIRGKPIRRDIQEKAMKVGWTFIIALLLFMTYSDLFRIFGK